MGDYIVKNGLLNMRENLQQIRNILLENATIPVERRTLFLKTREGEYRFIGVTVLTLRTIAKSYYNLDMEDLSRLITSEFNEERFLALAILIMQYQTAQDKEFLYNFYLNNIKHVNNWNLVYASVHHIIGAYLWDKEKDYLFTLTKSEILWERRIAIVATWYFIKNNTLDTTFEIAKLFLNDKHDLMHKAVGWDAT